MGTHKPRYLLPSYLETLGQVFNSPEFRFLMCRMGMVIYLLDGDFMKITRDNIYEVFRAPLITLMLKNISCHDCHFVMDVTSA